MIDKDKFFFFFWFEDRSGDGRWFEFGRVSETGSNRRDKVVFDECKAATFGLL